MTREHFRCVATLVIVGLLSPATAWAQFGVTEPGTVSGMGVVTVKEKAALVRMTIQLQEKGKTVKEALAKLADRGNAALLQLQSLGAKKSAIVASEPTLVTQKTDEERQMEQMLMRQMRSRGRAPKALQKPKSVTVKSTLTAEWPLTMETNAELLIFANTLQEKIEAADLGGLKEPKKLTPEEEELQAEMEEMMSGYSSYGNGQPKPGEPSFFYVARISQEARAKALATAFDKAKAQAQGLAVAARAKLGKLSSLSGSSNQANDDYGYNYAMRMAMMGAADSGTDENEAMVASPGEVTFQVMVNATFELE